MTSLRIRDTQTPGCARSTNDLLYLQYGYGEAPLNDGNVRSGAIGRKTNLWTQAYGYDSRNRLLSVTDTAYKQTYAYDVMGNRAIDSTANATDYFPEGATVAPYAAPSGVSTIFPRNQWSGAKYDDSGNMIEIKPLVWTYGYDAESRMVRAAGSKVAGYEYDGLGRRIRKFIEGTGQHWIYVYSADGSLAAEYPEVGSLPVTGRRYVVGDMLGSTRLTMNEEGVEQECMDYTPFGSEVAQSKRAGLACYPLDPEAKKASPDGVTAKFTGQERDVETGLDYFGARYLSSAMGRFASPDAPFADQHPEDPQSWNLYAYVRNCPLSLLDSTGRAIELVGDEEERQKALNAIKAGVGDTAGKYLYETNETGKDGKTRYYVGVYSGGPDGDGPALSGINPAANSLSEVIGSKNVVELGIVPPGGNRNGYTFGPSLLEAGDMFWDRNTPTPGLSTGAQVFILDPTTELGKLPGDVMSNRKALALDPGTLVMHELGHTASAWKLPSAAGTNSAGAAVRYENREFSASLRPAPGIVNSGRDHPAEASVANVSR